MCGSPLAHHDLELAGRESKLFRKVLGWLAITLPLPAMTLIWAAYRRDMSRTHKRVRGKSKVTSSAYGEIEYTEGGVGPHVLVVRKVRSRPQSQ
jgi:hypothetical protein